MKTPPRATNKHRSEENESEAQLAVEGSLRPGGLESPRAAGRQQALLEASSDMPLHSQRSGDRNPHRVDSGPYHPRSRLPGPRSMERRLGGSSLTQPSSGQPRYYSPFDRLLPDYASSSLGRSSGSRESPLSSVLDQRPLGSYDYQDGGGPEKTSTSIGRSLRSMSSPLYSSERERLLSSRVFVNPSFGSSALPCDPEHRVGISADRPERPLYASSFPRGQPRFATYTDERQQHRSASAPRARGDQEWSVTSLRQDRPSSVVGPGKSAVGASQVWDMDMDIEDVPFNNDEDWLATSQNRDRPSVVMGPEEHNFCMGQARKADGELVLTSAGRERPHSLMGRSAQFNSPTLECKSRVLGSRDVEQQRHLGGFRGEEYDDITTALYEERASDCRGPRPSNLGAFKEKPTEPSNAVLDKQPLRNFGAGITHSHTSPVHFEGGIQKQRTTTPFRENIPVPTGQGQLPPNASFSRGDGGQEGLGHIACAQKLAGPGPSFDALKTPGSGNPERIASPTCQKPTFHEMIQGRGQHLPDPRNVANVEDKPPTSACPVKLPSSASQGQEPQGPAIPDQGRLAASAYPPNYTGQGKAPASLNLPRDGPLESSDPFNNTTPRSVGPPQTPFCVKGLTSGVEQKLLPSGYPIHAPKTGNETQHALAPGLIQLQYSDPGALRQSATNNKERLCGTAPSAAQHGRPLPPPPGLPECLTNSTGKAELQFGPTELTDGSKGACNSPGDKEAYSLSTPLGIRPNVTQSSYPSWFTPPPGQALHTALPVSFTSMSTQSGPEQSAPTACQGKLPTAPVTSPAIRGLSTPSCQIQQSPQGPRLSLVHEALQYPLLNVRYPLPSPPFSQRPQMADVTNSAQRPVSVPIPRSGVTTSYPDPRLAPRSLSTTPAEARFVPTDNQERYRPPQAYLPSQPRLPTPGDVRQPSTPVSTISARTRCQLQPVEENLRPALPVSTNANARPGTPVRAIHENYAHIAVSSPNIRQDLESVGSANKETKSSPAKPDAGAIDKPQEIALRQGKANAPKQESKVYGPEVPGGSVEVIEDSTDTDNSSDVEVIESMKNEKEAGNASAGEVGSSLNTAKQLAKGPELKAQKISIQLQEPLLMKQEAYAKKQEALFRNQISANKSLEIEPKKQEVDLKSGELVTRIPPVVAKKPEVLGNNQNRELFKGGQAILSKSKKPIIAIKPITEIPTPVPETTTPIKEIVKHATEVDKSSTEIQKPVTEIQKPIKKQQPETIFYGPSIEGHKPITKNEEAGGTTADLEKPKSEEALPTYAEAKGETNPKKQEFAASEEEPKGGSEKAVASEKEPALMNEEVSSSTPENLFDGDTKEGPISNELGKTEKPSAALDSAPEGDDRQEDPNHGTITDEKVETTSSISYTESSDSDKSERYSFKKASKSKSKDRSQKKTSRKKHNVRTSYEDSESDDGREVENSTDGVCLSGRGNDGQVFGIPVVFKAIATTRTFWNIRATQVSRDIEEVVGDNVINQKINQAGFLCVNVATAGDAVKLLNLKKLGGVDVETVIPSMYLRHEAKIRGVPYHYTNEQLTQYFSHAGVVSARRQLTVKRLHDGSFEEYPRSSVVLAFKPDATLPKTLELGPDRFIVEEYIEAPMQCFKCLRFGHTARNCVSVSRCKNCGARYCQEECERKTPLCANCFGPHQATYVGCPRRREVAFASLWRKTFDIHAL